MVKHLTKHGNSLALVIEKPILDLLKIDATTPLEITTDGKSLTIRADGGRTDRGDFLNNQMERINREYAPVFTRLAQ
jgi:antitoxin component of MazEF toxin-antitoxin module